ncbi:molybdopterin-dependent oxidoreductase [Clostridium perfringens]|uniref:molybdopterin-dependent oxidoreductase n=1 Tax=Clostridium perfringens TaxID=1502 RepID=UPI0018A99F48|nr:molybdopterin-dependent oxidoreductase [Clostridium perfringens]EHR1329588.1 molybdopterin-dependent oxidoreductase [Clostridium perfringens]EHR1332714.1 molybdopterin-dependent oxidoreductase [Clostridium perfringens]EHR1426264.1 molybdopterin-dependent oxidoreductase [Clostridium perfringens]EIF6163758.1 molybdopterin-dependent oxidoreductase [Clostridium perfringens]MDK0535282.1 molybdopterin-dependent oxidoreductase [Clostridium perfringens]
MKRIQSTCNYCALACNLDFYTEDGKIKRVVPTPHYPVNKGFSCIKGLNLDKQCTKFNGSKKPLLKMKDGERKAIEWKEAFDLFASKMTAIQEKYGKESVAYISTGQLPTEEMALLGHVGRSYMGINGDGNTRLCMASAVVAYKQSFGFDAPPYTLKDLELSDTIFFIGANPVIAHPIAWGRVRKNKDAKIITIDPRKSETAMNSDMWIDIKTKGDLALFYTLANVLIEKGWIDQDYINNYTEGFEDFKAHVKKYTLEDVEERTGISKMRVLELAKIIHEGKRVSFWWTMGVNQSYEAVRTAQAIINLALITGNMGREGTGANSLTGQCNAMGSRMFSNTTALYGGGEYNNKERRKVVADILGMDENMLPSKPTLDYEQIIKGINKGEIKGLWVICTNPRHSFSNNEEFKKAMKNLDFFVVQDIYEDTDSSKECDLYLPSVPAIKKEGFLINTERRLSAMVPVLEKEEDELSDYEIFLGIGEALGMGSLLDKWRTPKDAFNLLRECSKGMPCDITGVTYERLRGSKGIQWPCREGEELEADERRLFEDGKYYTPSGKAKFIFEDVTENPNATNEEFPFNLNTGRGTVGQWHTHTRTREIQAVTNIVSQKAYVDINRKDAERLDIKENDEVLIHSSNGHTSKFIARLTDNLKEKDLYAPIHYIETNLLTPSVFDPYSKEPSYKTVQVNIEKVRK